MAPEMLQVFLNVDLRCSHDGLAKIAKDNGIDVTTLKPGTFVAFINTEKTKIKLYAASNIIAYLKVPSGKIMMETISLIPKAFTGSGKINYDAALKQALVQALTKKKRLDLEILNGRYAA